MVDGNEVVMSVAKGQTVLVGKYSGTKVKIDDADDIERWLEGEEDAENEQVAGSAAVGGDDGGTLPDDNISQYGADDEPQDAAD